MTTLQRKILVVDDNSDLLILTCRYLEDVGYSCVRARGAYEAVERMRQASFDLILSDIHMPDGSGLELFESVKQLAPETPFVFMTAAGDIVFEAMRDQTKAPILKKPFSGERLVQAVADAIAKAKAA